MELQKTKECGKCGKEYTEIDESTIIGNDEMGVWFNCPCNSTLLVTSSYFIIEEDETNLHQSWTDII